MGVQPQEQMQMPSAFADRGGGGLSVLACWRMSTIKQATAVAMYTALKVDRCLPISQALVGHSCVPMHGA
jgi:hypothetical protein